MPPHPVMQTLQISSPIVINRISKYGPVCYTCFIQEWDAEFRLKKAFAFLYGGKSCYTVFIFSGSRCMRKKLLLVEDNAAHEELTRLALKKTGFDHDLTVVRDGTELLEYLFRQGRYIHLTRSDMPDLILLDLKLPRMDGLEVLKKLKTDGRTRSIPIVMLSSSTEENDIRKSYKLGANSYVHKRMNALEFNEVLRDILSYWFEFAKLPPRVYVEE